MVNEDAILIAMGCGMLAAILDYLIIYLYNKYNDKVLKWRAGILLVDFIFLAILINSIIVALMTPFISIIIQNTNTFTACVLSICIIGGINALISLTSKEFKKKGRKFLLHYAVATLIFTFLSIFIEITNLRGINVFHLCLIISSIFNFYYYKTLDLEEIKSTKEIQIKKANAKPVSKKKNKITKVSNINKLPIIITIIIAITFIIIISVFLFFNYQNEKLKNERLNEVQTEEENRQYDLQSCYSAAEQSRTNLWNANCPDGQTGCKLDSSVVDWIDSRYEQDIENCNSLYG